MLGIFRTNQLWNTFLFIFYALFVRIYFCFVPVEPVRGGEGPLSQAVLAFFPEGIYGNLIATALIIIQGVAITWMVSRHRLDREVTLFSGLFYILFASITWWFLPLSPVLLANTFFIFALNELFGTYRKKTCADKIFNIGFLTALSSLFYPAYILMLLVGILGLSSLRRIDLKEVLILLSGFLSVYFLMGVFNFWNDSLALYIEQITSAYRFGDLFQTPLDIDTLVVLAFFGGLSLYVLSQLNGYLSRKNIHAQKSINILVWVWGFGLLSMLIQKEIYWRIDHFLILAIPLSILISFNFANARNKALASSIHLALLAMVLLFHFKNLI